MERNFIKGWLTSVLFPVQLVIYEAMNGNLEGLGLALLQVNKGASMSVISVIWQRVVLCSKLFLRTQRVGKFLTFPVSRESRAQVKVHIVSPWPPFCPYCQHPTWPLLAVACDDFCLQALLFPNILQSAFRIFLWHKSNHVTFSQIKTK